MIAICNFLINGFVGSMKDLAGIALFLSYGVPAAQAQIYLNTPAVLSAMVPAICILSTVLPFRGFNKAPYMIVAGVLGVAGAAFIGLLPAEQLSVKGAVLCLCCIGFSDVLTKVFIQTRQVEKASEKPDCGPNLFSFSNAGLYACMAVATLLVGPLATWNARAPFAAMILPFASVLLPGAMNWLQEQRQDVAARSLVRRQLVKQREITVLTFFVSAWSFLLLLVTMAGASPSVAMAVSIAAVSTLSISFAVFLRPDIARYFIYTMVVCSCSVSLKGAYIYFLTDPPAAYPEGPHFSLNFILTVIPFASSILAVVAVAVYNRLMSGWTFRAVFMMLNKVILGLYLLDVILFSRLNQRAGLPDWALILGGDALFTALAELRMLPCALLLSQLSPKGMEASLMGLLWGVCLLGVSVAINSGAFILERLGCSPAGRQGESAEFDRLWIASLVPVAGSLVSIAVTPLLIPDMPQKGSVRGDEGADATAGSLWKHWRQGSSKPSCPSSASLPSVSGSVEWDEEEPTTV